MKALIITLLAALAFPAAASATPVVTLEVGPNPAHRGDKVTAKATIEHAVGQVLTRWLVDDTPAPKFDDATEVSLILRNLGAHTIKVRVGDETTSRSGPVDATQTIVVQNAAPVAAIALDPAAPVTGQKVTISSASTDPDGDALTCAWDLDGDGTFERPGCQVSHTFDAPGVFPVVLGVSDGTDTATTARVVTIGAGPVVPGIQDPVFQDDAPAPAAAPPPLAVAPARIAATLRYAFTRTPSTTTFTSLLVRHLPAGAFVKARCKGGGCAKKTFTAVAKSDSVSLKTMIRHRLKAGAVITVEVTKPGMTPRTIVVTVRKGRDPKLAGK